jgi:hypothetical protein
MKVYIDNNNSATVLGEYSAWLELRKTCESLGFPLLTHCEIVGEPHNIRRMAEYLRLYWSQIRRVSVRKAWEKLAELAECSLVRTSN